MLKPYKDAAKNTELRKAVRTIHTKSISVSWKYCSVDEKILDIMHWLNITNYAFAKRVWEIISADGEHDQLATRLYGFNQYMA